MTTTTILTVFFLRHGVHPLLIKPFMRVCMILQRRTPVNDGPVKTYVLYALLVYFTVRNAMEWHGSVVGALDL